MQPPETEHQAPVPLWSTTPEANCADQGNESECDALRERINELERIVADYESLLSELPELFERKFQQRLDPLMERYRLLARAQQLLDEPGLPLIEEPSNPLIQKPIPFLERWRQNHDNSQPRSDRSAA